MRAMSVHEDMSPYALGSDKKEQERLEHQAGLLNEITERFLRGAGLEPGMRVLDLGCGLGDVAMLAARIVGADGEVVAIDRDPAMVETARRRINGNGSHVRVVEGDLMSLDLAEPPFDAAIGRLILMHLPDPVAALRAVTGHVRPGGLVAFQDYTTAEVRVHPPLPKTERALKRIAQTFELLGADVHGGDNLRATFLAAGLPEPQLSLEALVGGSADDPVFQMVSGVTRTLLPAMENLRLVKPGEIDPQRLEQEMREEVSEGGGVVVAPPMVGAWARV
jgi:SAM-dependent methyltransferase